MTRLAALVAMSLCLLTFAAGAQQASPTDQLLARLQNLSHMRGDFEQLQYGEDNAVLATSSGGFKLLRPVYFSWEIRSPDRQIIVANADYLWHYDIDLQTATRRPVAGNIEASPLQVLAGDEAALREQYTVEQTAADTFILVPNDSAHSFRRLTVTFEGEALSTMDITDKLGQRVLVQFRAVDSETPLQSTDFDFTPPAEGVDLFYYDE